MDILLKPTGNAPIIKKKKWTVDGDKKISWVIKFMRKYLKLESNEKLVNISNMHMIYFLMVLLVSVPLC